MRTRVYSILIAVSLPIAAGLCVIGCGDSRGPSGLGGTPGGPEVATTAATATTTQVLGTTAAVIASVNYTGNPNQDMILGGNVIEVSRPVKGLHLTTTNGTVIGVGTKQADGSWLVTPVQGPVLTILWLHRGESKTTQIRADVSEVIGQEVSVRLRTIVLLDDGRTNRFIQDKHLDLGRFIANQAPLPLVPTTLPEAGPVPDPVNFVSPVPNFGAPGSPALGR